LTLMATIGRRTFIERGPHPSFQPKRRSSGGPRRRVFSRPRRQQNGEPSEVTDSIHIKAACAVREIVSIDARYSSQTCGRCLQVDAKSRRRRRFRCVACGWTCHADVAAALEIRRRAELQRTSELSRVRTPLTSQDAA
jgi:hypothetical protein